MKHLNRQHTKIAFPTCEICANFDPLRSKCKLKQHDVREHDIKNAAKCRKDGYFVRYIPLVPRFLHYNGIADMSTSYFVDWDRVSKNENGQKIFVHTKRGVEIPVPANLSVQKLTIGKWNSGVARIETYQGQREIIYELGVIAAREIAKKKGVELTVLPDEEHWNGIPHLVEKYYDEVQIRERRKRIIETQNPDEWDERIRSLCNWTSHVREDMEYKENSPMKETLNSSSISFQRPLEFLLNCFLNITRYVSSKIHSERHICSK
ncbi:hypothetical protein [Bacillus sp. Marseille-P3661]|uniref:hypothetical protein n=1 Tax=Bacillus sp. Marseille-P3661 TaxID=1936234 RepID=UPI000C82D021|nr:hypothetical protein [Bacillus sp. Marseille-P3661]